MHGGPVYSEVGWAGLFNFMKIKMDRKVAYAAATDAGNRNMAKGGRTKWNQKDYATAVDTWTKLMGLIDPEKPA